MTRERDTYNMFTQDHDRERFGDEQPDRSNHIELTVCLHHDTGRERNGAVLVSLDGNESHAQWIPHSLIEIERKSGTVRGTRKDGQVVELSIIMITLPSTIAAQKRLV